MKTSLIPSFDGFHACFKTFYSKMTHILSCKIKYQVNIL